MSKDILVLNEDGEEIAEENRATLTTQDVDSEEHQTHPAPFKQQRSGKKGFRIDDILFSVSNNVLRSSSCLSVVSNSHSLLRLPCALQTQATHHWTKCHQFSIYTIVTRHLPVMTRRSRAWRALPLWWRAPDPGHCHQHWYILLPATDTSVQMVSDKKNSLLFVLLKNTHTHRSEGN